MYDRMHVCMYVVIIRVREYIHAYMYMHMRIHVCMYDLSTLFLHCTLHPHITKNE